MATQNHTQTTQNPKQKKDKNYVVVDFLDLDTSKFSFLASKANAHGGHFIPVRYDGKALYVKYEARTCPFGISTSCENKKPEYPDGKKITGYTTSVSCHKDYENDPYYKKALELDEFFIDVCDKNSLQWSLGGTAKRPLGREMIEGFDDRGADGKWKRFLKWSYKKDESTNERNYLDYPPRLEFGIPTTSMTEHKGPDGLMVQEATFKTVFFDQEGQKYDSVTSNEMNEVLPKFSRLSVMAQWATITQGTYGATLKPKAQQFRVFPSEQMSNDECLLDDDEDEHDIGDQLGNDFGGVTKLNNSAPAPLDAEDEEGDEKGDALDAEEDIEVAGEFEGEDTDSPAPTPKRMVTRPTRKVFTAKKA